MAGVLWKTQVVMSTIEWWYDWGFMKNPSHHALSNRMKETTSYYWLADILHEKYKGGSSYKEKQGSRVLEGSFEILSQTPSSLSKL